MLLVLPLGVLENRLTSPLPLCSSPLDIGRAALGGKWKLYSKAFFSPPQLLSLFALGMFFRCKSLAITDTKIRDQGDGLWIHNISRIGRIYLGHQIWLFSAVHSLNRWLSNLYFKTSYEESLPLGGCTKQRTTEELDLPYSKTFAPGWHTTALKASYKKEPSGVYSCVIPRKILSKILCIFFILGEKGPRKVSKDKEHFISVETSCWLRAIHGAAKVDLSFCPIASLGTKESNSFIDLVTNLDGKVWGLSPMNDRAEYKN